MTTSAKVHRRLALHWGVIPFLLPAVGDTDALFHSGEDVLRRAGHVKPGDRIVILGGRSHTAGATNLLKVHTVS